MKNFSFDIEFKNEEEYKQCISDLFTFVYELNRKIFTCFKVKNKIKIGIKFAYYKDDGVPALVSFNDLLKWKLEAYKFSNIKCWSGKKGWKELFDEVEKEKDSCLIFSLGLGFPYELCEKMGMPTLSKAMEMIV